MFVDASALIAIITREPEGEALAARLEAAQTPVTSPVAVYEAVLGIGRKKQGGLIAARADVALLLDIARIRVIPLLPEDADHALAAFERYGKETGHPARLNMGDCFAYAVAHRQGASLLLKGEDFSHTDLGAR